MHFLLCGAHTSLFGPVLIKINNGPIASTPPTRPADVCLAEDSRRVTNYRFLWQDPSLFEVVGLMCPPERRCEQPPIQPRDLSAALIGGSLNGTWPASLQF